MTPEQEAVLERLRWYAERDRHHNVTLGYLASSLGMSRRNIEEAVEGLRLAGEPIVGGTDGVKLSTDADELAAYVEGRRRRAAQIHRGTMALRTTLRRMRFGDQETLWDRVA